MNPSLWESTFAPMARSFKEQASSFTRKGYFARMADAYIRRVPWQGFAPAPGGGSRVGVLITPWMQTPVPFFNIEIAHQLQREGCDVTLIWDGQDVFSNIAWKQEAVEIERVLSVLKGRFRICDLSEASPSSRPVEEAQAQMLISENAVRFALGETAAADFLEKNARAASALAEHIRLIRGFLEANQFDWLLIPGGIWVSSGAFCLVAREMGLDYSTYDSGDGSLWFAVEGVAAHSHDLPSVLRRVHSITERTSDAWMEMCRKAHQRLDQRMQGKDEWNLQLTPAGTASDVAADIFVPLNSRWDAAALLRQDLFDSIADWLAFLSDYVRCHPGVTMAVRQHPGERYPGFEAHDDWESILFARGDADGRIRFYGADSTVNSYDLIRSAKVVLPYTSRIGIESAMLGLPVVLSSLCFYRDCGFTEAASSVVDYETLIDRGLRGELTLDASSVELAHVAYFLIENCLELKTSFTPMPGDFNKWVKIPPELLWKEKNNSTLMKALMTRQPLGFVNFENSHVTTN